MSQPAGESEDTLPRKLADEIRRIGLDEFIRRTEVPAPVVAAVLNGAAPAEAHRKAFAFYRFGPYPDLRYLLACYFYEGFSDYDARRWRPALERFIREEWAGYVIGAAGDIRRLLGTASSEAELGAMADEMGAYFSPDRAGLTHREWLTIMHDRMLVGLAQGLPRSGHA